MKLESRRTEAFLSDPGAVRVVLLYGEDVGLIRARGTRLVRSVAGTAGDPFRVTELERDEADAVPGEMAALSLAGGRRAVRVRDATDATLGPVRKALAGPGQALLVLEAPGLTSKSKLRAFVEAAADGMAVPCYPAEGKSLEQAIRTALAGLDATADDEAIAWLGGQLGADLGVTLREVEKVALFVGPGGRIDLAAARQCVADLAGLSLEDALFAATGGDVAGADRALELAMAEGAAAVQVVRAGLQHVHRLQRARATMGEGASASEAARRVRPPLFFRRVGAFTTALTTWSAEALEWAAQRFWEAERACKRTGAPAETIARNALSGVAQRAASLRLR